MTDTSDDHPDYLPPAEAIYAEIDAEADDITSLPSINGIDADPFTLATLANLKPTMSTLSPEDRKIVGAKLDALPDHLRASKVEELVRERMAELACEARLRAGPGLGANALTVARWENYRDARDLEQEATRITERLEAVSHFDKATGAPVLRFPPGDFTTRQLEAERASLLGRAQSYREGALGQSRLAKAREEAFKAKVADLTSQYVAATAKRRAEAQLVEERIERLATARANVQRNTIA